MYIDAPLGLEYSMINPPGLATSAILDIATTALPSWKHHGSCQITEVKQLGPWVALGWGLDNGQWTCML